MASCNMMIRCSKIERVSEFKGGKLYDKSLFYIPTVIRYYNGVPAYAKQDADFSLDNELFPNRDENEPRYLRDEDISNDDVLNTKFVYSEEPAISIKLSDLRTAPRFRPTSPKPTTTLSTEETTDKLEETTITTLDPEEEVKLGETTASSPTATGSDTAGTKPSAVLFQDMDEDKDKVPTPNYQMRGV